jgi:hypothetical protein
LREVGCAALDGIIRAANTGRVIIVKSFGPASFGDKLNDAIFG